jgi:hypothetical protein
MPPTSPRSTPPLSADLVHDARRRAAAAALAAYAFGDFTITESGRWDQTHGESGGVGGTFDRWSCVVVADDDDGRPHRAQFNVCFLPGDATPSDIYEGDWVALED